MVDGTGKRPKNDDEKIQALQDLVSSPGWRIFCEEARRMHGPEALAGDLLTAARVTTDMATLGSLTSARISVLNAVDQLVAWPNALLEQHRNAYERGR